MVRFSTTTTSGQPVHLSSSITSSPVTSISDSHNGDGWMSSPQRRDARDDLSPMSETSAQLGSMTRNSNSSKACPISMRPIVDRAVFLATSQARGESSDIDFSWIREEENKLKNERGEQTDRAEVYPTTSGTFFVPYLFSLQRTNACECYFGMDPPKLEDTPLTSHTRSERDEKENYRSALKSRSSTHLEDRQMEYSARREMGPMARRLQRMQ
ncbi:hypothetical protein OSTOST_25095, partial [Ostertagia ostertagi]